MVATVTQPVPVYELNHFAAIAIGASTGAPRILESILRCLPADMPVPIFVAQHMPPMFTETFARRLDLISPLTVVHAEDGMPVFNGVVYVGVGHQHMRVIQGVTGESRGDGQKRIEISKEPTEKLYYPSADELLRSCGEVYRRPVLGVVLSGIGSDGLIGAQKIKERGGNVLTQSESTCAVYGMPRACVEAGVSDAVLDPDDIASVLLQLSPQHRSQALL